MAPMQPISKSARARSGPTEEFVELCKTLYGDAVDPEVVWGDVIKLSPDQADLHANRNAKIRRNVERGLQRRRHHRRHPRPGRALKDERLDPEKNPSVGRVGRTLHRTGQKMPKMLSRIQNKKVQAGLATAAVGTQLANLGGDALIAGTLGKKPAKARRRKSDYALAKRGNPAAVPRDLRPQVQGLRKPLEDPGRQHSRPDRAGSSRAGARRRHRDRQADQERAGHDVLRHPQRRASADALPEAHSCSCSAPKRPRTHTPVLNRTVPAAPPQSQSLEGVADAAHASPGCAALSPEEAKRPRPGPPWGASRAAPGRAGRREVDVGTTSGKVLAGGVVP